MTTSHEVPVGYTIAHSTPHSGRYVPENILVDKPHDQLSRWSGAYQANTKQWLLLRLESLAVLKKITFGKFSKPHPCNMKEFKVYVGVAEDNMTLVLHAGLKNNLEPETFELRHINKAGVVFPTRFVKIEPLGAHGQSFHISIWHVALNGIVDPSYIEEVSATYEEHRETTVLRHILKHLRQRRLLTPFKSIIERSDLRLEHPLISQLHESIVLQGDWARAEQLLTTISDHDLFTRYLYSCQPQAIWTRISGTDADGDVPSPRGGHAMCMDPENQMIYLLGGWDGQKSLDDFWVYSVREDKWRILSHSTSREHNAPGARSCHKMVFDTKTGNIYVLGRLDDSDGRASGTRSGTSSSVPNQTHGTTIANQSSLRQQVTPPASQNATPVVPPTKTYCSEFYRYQTRGIDAGKWVFMSFDTATSGGPPLVFDHQMVIDSESQILYVFGGRVVDGDWETLKYSGLYSYNVRLSKWKLLQNPDASTDSSQVIIPSRFGHSMVLEPKTKQLFIFGGQKDQRYLSDMYAYDINTNKATELYSNFTASGGPDPCFTQRAVIDPLLKEIYVFCGLTRSSAASSQNTALRSSPSNWVCRYEPRPGKWSQILRHPDSPSKEVPLPRFAHQVVYHPDTRTVFLHGGNAGGLTAAEREKVSQGGNSNSASGAASTPDGQEQGRTGESNGRPATEGREPSSSPNRREKRLDDFWKMELKRPGVEEVIRRAKFRIRRQQFREMCEEASPVRALQFLQTEVSSVVDHKDPAEAEIFRALLTHLLAPPAQPPIPFPKTLRRLGSDSGSSETSSAEQDDSEGQEGGKGRQRRPSGTWTSELPGEGEEEGSSSGAQPFPQFHRGTAETLRGIIDPLELAANSSSSGGNGGGSAALKPVLLSSGRYEQRTEVFDGLLDFVAEEEKEPIGDLLDLVNQDAMEDGILVP